MSERPWGPRKQLRAKRILKRLVERLETSPREYLLPLRAGEELSVSGKVDVRVVQGCVEIWGAVLRPSSTFQRVVVPPWVAMPRLRAKTSDCTPEGSESIEDADINDFVTLHGWPTVICVRSPAGLSLAAMREALLAPIGQPRLAVHKAWPSLVDKFGSDSAQQFRPPVLLVMGPKGVGKSSCCRYFVNALLGSSTDVCFLETDVGQPELGPPGLVSLHRVRTPLLEVPYSQQSVHDCVAAFFAGGSTPAVHPAIYLKSIRAAFDAYLELCESHGETRMLPLVVNSHGWVTGVGLELVRTIIAITQPLLVVRIRTSVPELSASRSQDVASGSSLPVKRKREAITRCGPLALAFEEAAGVSIASSPSCVLIDVATAATPGSTVKGSPSAPETRWMRLAHYFRPDLDLCKAPVAMALHAFFGHASPVRVPLRSLQFGLIYGEVEATEVEAMFVGTLVALCKVTNDSVSRAESTPYGGGESISNGAAANPLEKITVLRKSEWPLQYIAYGFIHSFDFGRSELVLYTRSSPEKLSIVNAVMRGELFWEPHSTRGQKVSNETASPLSPHCASWVLEGMGTGARVISLRKNVGRKRLRITKQV